MLGVQTVGPERAYAILRALLAAVLVVNFVSIPLIHQAVHLSGESDPQLVGNWRGLYFHKNITGAVCSITALLFFFRALDTRRAGDWLIFTGAVLFTVMTRSKTSLALLPIAIFAGVLFRSTGRGTLGRWIVAALGALALTVSALAFVVDFHTVERFLTNPTELTGRVAIWQGEIAFIRDHALLGAGFGSFADTGALSPLYNYVADKWVQGEAHGHNAYLQLCVTMGSIGFILAMIAFIVGPMLVFRRIDRGDEAAFFAPLFAIFVFIVLHNFAESDFLESDGPAWVAFLLTLGCLHTHSVWQDRPLLACGPPWSAP
jgi:O-antigen ligase